MAKEEKNLKIETAAEEVTASGKDAKSTALVDTKSEKTGLWSWIKERSIPVKIALGVVTGAVITGVAFAGKAIIDMLTDGEETEEPEESCESEAPQDE